MSENLANGESAEGQVQPNNNPSLTGTITFNDFQPLEPDPIATLPDFPMEALPDSLQAFCKTCCENIEAVPEMAASEVLGAISACCHGKYVIQPRNGYREPVNLFMLIVSDPSDRKSPSMDIAKQPIIEYEQRFNKEHKKEISRCAEKLEELRNQIAKEKRKKNADIDKITDLKCQLSEEKENAVHEIQLVTGDITQEALPLRMKDNKERMAIINGEADIFGTMAGRYSSNPSIAVFKQGYSMEQIVVDRVGRENIKLLHPVLTIMLAMQPSVLQTVISNPVFHGEGLTARFLYCMAKPYGRKIFDVPYQDTASIERYSDILHKILEYDPPQPRIILPSKEATKALARYYDYIQDEIEALPNLSFWLGKAFGHTMRILALLHVYRQFEINGRYTDTPLTKEEVESAILIGKFYVRHAQAAFSSNRVTEKPEIRNAKYVIKRIKHDLNAKNAINAKNGIPPCYTSTSLKRLCQSIETAEEMQKVLKTLENRGFVKVVKTPTGKKGRPKVDIYVNPEALKNDVSTGMQ